MTQIALVIYPGFTALDVVGPYEVLSRLPGADIRFVWHETGPVTADSGALILAATHTFAETPAPDVILVPGGSASVLVRARDRTLVEWLQNASATASWTASVCAGSVILGAAGLLRDRRATSHWQTVPLLRGFGAIPVADERVVHDGVVTGAGVSAGIDLALWLAGQIGSEKRAKAIQLAIEYDPRPPFDSGSIQKASKSTATAANLLLTKESANPKQVAAGVGLLWDQAIGRSRRVRRRGRAVPRT